MLYLIDSLLHVIDDYARKPDLTPETRSVLEDLANLSIVFREFLLTTNADEKIQRLIHHSMLATRTALEQRRRAIVRQQSLLGMAEAQGAAPQQEMYRNAGLQLVQMVLGGTFRNTIYELAMLVRDIADTGIYGPPGEPAYGLEGQIPAGRQERQREFGPQTRPIIGGSVVEDGQRYNMYREVYADGGEFEGRMGNECK